MQRCITPSLLLDKNAEAGTKAQYNTVTQAVHDLSLWVLLSAGNSEISSDSLLPSVWLLWTPSAIVPRGQHTLLLHGKQALPKRCTQRVAPASDKQKLFPDSFPQRSSSFFYCKNHWTWLTAYCLLILLYIFPKCYFKSHFSLMLLPSLLHKNNPLILISYLTKTNVA